MKSVRIFDEETQLEVGFEIIAQQIEIISESLKRLKNTRVTRKLIVALIHDDTRLSKSQIETILDSFKSLEEKYLMPKKKQEER